FVDLVLLADHEEAEGGCAVGVVEADEMGTSRGGVGDFDGEGSGGCGGFEFNLGGVGPGLERPRVEFAGGGDCRGGAALRAGGIKIIESGRGGARGATD